VFARVTTYHADQSTDGLLQGFQDTIGPLQVVEGFSHAYFLVDQDTRQGRLHDHLGERGCDVS
jgi:hypothetical protein